MRILLITAFLLSSLIAEQNNSTAFGTKTMQQENFKTFRQADGSSFKGIVRGEEFFNYIELANGYICLYNKESRRYEYALVKDGKLLPSGISVTQEMIPTQIKQISHEDLQQLQHDAFKTHL